METHIDHKKLFGQLCEQSLIDQYEADLEKYAGESTKCSRLHYKKLRMITGVKIKRKPALSKKVIILLVAAILLLLTGCSFLIYQQQKLGNFLFSFLPDYTRITLPNEENSDRIVETRYKLTYVPDGFVQTKERLSRNISYYVWDHPNGGRITFYQHSSIGSLDLNIDESTRQPDIEFNFDFEVHCYDVDGHYLLLWENGGYYYLLTAYEPIEEIEFPKMIESIEIYSQEQN